MNNKPNNKPRTGAPETGATAEPLRIPYTTSNNGPFGTFPFPNALREMAEKSVTQARDTYTKMKTAAEDATDLVESTVDAAREGAIALSVKTLDSVKTNSDASFALARDLFGAKTLSEVIELQTAYARRLFETVTAQMKEFQQLTEKVVTDTTRPVSAQVQKSMNKAAA